MDAKHIERLKKFVTTRAAFKKKVGQERQGQNTAEESARRFRHVTDAVLGKQPDVSALSPEELKKSLEKDY